IIMAMVYQEFTSDYIHIDSNNEDLNNFLSNDNFIKLKSMMKTKKVMAGSHLFWESDAADRMFYIHSGKVKLKMASESGTELLLSINREGSLLGEFGGTKEKLQYEYRAEVIEDAEVGIILESDLKKLMYQFGNFAVEFMSWISWSQRETQKKLYDCLIFGKAG